MIELFGIKNCDKVKAAKKWLEAKNIDYQFQDIRDFPLSEEQWVKWISILGFDQLINRRSTTWKQLPQHRKENINNQSAAKLLNDNPTLMKRPLLVISSIPTNVGFSAKQYEDIFNQ